MSTRSGLLAVLALALASSACQPPAQEPAGLSEEDVAAIRAFTESFAEAVQAGDWATVAAYYAEDAVIMPPNEPAVEGRAAIRAWWEPSSTITQFTLRPIEIDGRGDLAYARATYSIIVTPEGVPEPIQDTGKGVMIFRKQADGSWLAVVRICNSDLPLREGGSGT